MKRGSADGLHYRNLAESHEYNGLTLEHKHICTGNGATLCTWEFPPRIVTESGYEINSESIQRVIDELIERPVLSTGMVCIESIYCLKYIVTETKEGDGYQLELIGDL